MTNQHYPQKQYSYNDSFISTMNRVYLLMFSGLFVTALAALLGATVPSIQNAIFGSSFAFYGLMIGELVLVLVISAGINKMSSPTALTLFFIYAFVNGLTLSVIFLVYIFHELFCQPNRLSYYISGFVGYRIGKFITLRPDNAYFTL